MNFLRIVIAAAFLCGSFSYSFADNKDLLLSLKAAEDYNNKMKYSPKKRFKIYDRGTEKWIDYSKYGELQNIGTDKYRYKITDFAGLAKASGEGIYPNTKSVLESPEYKKMFKRGRLKGDKWKFVNTDNHQENFYKWATTKDEEQGVIMYFTAFALDKAGHYEHALKAYYACLVMFPNAVGWTEYKTLWYMAPVCMDRINFLTREYPELGVKLEGASVRIENSFDNDKSNDIFYVNPGKLVPAVPNDFERKYINLEEIGIKKITGEGKTKLVEYNNGHFQLTVDGKPYVIRGITYGPNKVGLYPGLPGFNNNSDWSHDDYDKNGKVDGPYDAWIDANRNEKQDKNEKRVGDFAIMQEMGINTLRIYHPTGINKELLKEGYENFGFMHLIGNFAGMYAVDSGATWEEGTDYRNETHKKNMMESIRKMVEDYKDEPYVLMWVLGNENNYSSIGTTETSSTVESHPEAYYKFVNECAKLIKSLDPQKRPVAISNGDLGFIELFAKYCPDIDIFGSNAYRGAKGFGRMWGDIADITGKAALITEYGCPAYAQDWTTARIELGQADYHKGNWINIEDNMCGVVGGTGNALGGVIFEWTDEWWKAQEDSNPYTHDTHKQFGGAFLDGSGYEEWFGICGIGEDGKDSTFKRYLRKSYFMYRDLWKKYKN